MRELGILDFARTIMGKQFFDAFPRLVSVLERIAVALENTPIPYAPTNPRIADHVHHPQYLEVGWEGAKASPTKIYVYCTKSGCSYTDNSIVLWERGNG